MGILKLMMDYGHEWTFITIIKGGKCDRNWDSAFKVDEMWLSPQHTNKYCSTEKMLNNLNDSAPSSWMSQMNHSFLLIKFINLASKWTEACWHYFLCICLKHWGLLIMHKNFCIVNPKAICIKSLSHLHKQFGCMGGYWWMGPHIYFMLVL